MTGISPTNWKDIAYLRHGNARQRKAYQVLNELQVFEILADYSPVLAGTIPLDISLPGSDLDILCEAIDLVAFQDQVVRAFKAYPKFRIKEKDIKHVASIVANFQFIDFPIEIFAQPRPVEQQHAYQHMVVEARLLEIGGPQAKEAIRRLKQSGLKTEPAFARYFNLPDDGFEILLDFFTLNDEELRIALNQTSQLPFGEAIPQDKYHAYGKKTRTDQINERQTNPGQ